MERSKKQMSPPLADVRRVIDPLRTSATYAAPAFTADGHAVLPAMDRVEYAAALSVVPAG
jgi:hypothetical protein